KLTEVKQQLPHGQFSLWLEQEFQWSQDTAEKWMQVTEHFGEIRNVAEFDVSALYVLSARSPPEEARDEARDRARRGEHVTHKRAKSIVRKYVSKRGGAFSGSTRRFPDRV